MSTQISFDNIRAEVARHRMTITELCEKIGVERRTFYNWEENGDFPSSYLCKMVDVLGVSADEILGR